jgi:hypothetical protein
MENAAGDGASIQSDDQLLNSIVADLASLISQAQTSIKLVEAAIATGALGSREAANIVVLDDITPRRSRAHTVLEIRNRGQGPALRFVLDAKPGEFDASNLRAAYSIVRA